MDRWNTIFLLQRPIFRGELAVSFREGSFPGDFFFNQKKGPSFDVAAGGIAKVGPRTAAVASSTALLRAPGPREERRMALPNPARTLLQGKPKGEAKHNISLFPHRLCVNLLHIFIRK